MNIAILTFDGAEELDFVGPWEVFTMSNEVFVYQDKDKPDHVFLVSETGGAISCAKGMRVENDFSLSSAPEIDVLVIPGGRGTRREVDNDGLLQWIADQAEGCTWVTSVCTGAMLLTAAGPAKGKRVTTHWGFVETLRDRNEAAEVLADARYVQDGNIVTAAGVSAGIDMALWLVGQIHGEDHARAVQRGMEYDPEPPYARVA